MNGVTKVRQVPRNFDRSTVGAGYADVGIRLGGTICFQTCSANAFVLPYCDNVCCHVAKSHYPILTVAVGNHGTSTLFTWHESLRLLSASDIRSRFRSTCTRSFMTASMSAENLPAKPGHNAVD
ncbi:hypothetical protein TNCV_991771 [Trichonephila clavipes]|nr:hypothetical protein TNCV_991771 [Trichonephila clavipes]